MVADQRLGELEILDEVADAELLDGEAFDDAPPRWFGERLEGLSSPVHSYINEHAYVPLLIQLRWSSEHLVNGSPRS